jgi:1,2-diacylglycerol 3-alpha-glucosyltransferase
VSVDAPLRIAIVTATYVPSRNGVATSTALFVRGLEDLGHQVRVFAPAHPDAQPDVGIERLPSLRAFAPADYPLLLPASRRTLARLHDFAPDVIHTMHPFVAGRMSLRAGRRNRTPVVFTAHTQYHAYAGYVPVPRALAVAAARSHVRRFAERVDAVLAPGPAIVETLRAYGYAGAVTMLPNPVDTHAYAGPGDETLAASLRDGAGDLLLFVGRIGPEKGLPLLLAAFDRVRRVRSATRLIVVGDGPLRATLSAAAPPGVAWVGAVAHARVGDFLRVADLFVSGSTTEVLPMTFLEALAAGTPVVAADSAAARSMLGEDAIAAATPDALAATILAQLSASDRGAARHAARQRAGFYDVIPRSRALVDVYRATLAERGG